MFMKRGPLKARYYIGKGTRIETWVPYDSYDGW